MGSQKDRYNYILQVIDDRLIPDDSAKKNRGEVFTPPDLVRETLFGLRKDKLEKGITEIWGIDKDGEFTDEHESNRIGGLPNSVWRNPNLKWLDPANGIGNFPIIAFYKLDYELSKVDGYKNKDKRQQHIIEKMLYMIELDKGNCITCRQIFKKISPNAKPNILCANTMELTDAKFKSSFGINRFNIFMGNPPFQNGKDSNFYVKFLNLALNIGENEFYLIFIIPNRIFIPQHPANEAILKAHPFFIIHTVNKTYFPDIPTEICAVSCHRTDAEYNNITLCKFSDNLVNIDLTESTPSSNDSYKVKRLCNKILEKSETARYTIEKKRPNNGEYIFISRQWNRFSPYQKKGGDLTFKYISDKSSEDDGKYFIINGNKDCHIWYLTKSTVIRFITKLFASSMNVPPFLWNKIPKKENCTKNDEDLYKWYSLDDDEINLIKKILKEDEEGIKKKLEKDKTRKSNKSTESTKSRYTHKTRKLRRH